MPGKAVLWWTERRSCHSGKPRQSRPALCGSPPGLAPRESFSMKPAQRSRLTRHCSGRRASLIAGGQGWARYRSPAAVSERGGDASYPSESRMNRVLAGFAVDDRAYVQGYSACVREYFSMASGHFRTDQ